eukprot:15327893-Ditylum_brightwellii.AAC.1
MNKASHRAHGSIQLKTDKIKAQFVELDKAVASHLDNPNFVQEGLPDMMYEEVIKDEMDQVNKGIDNPLSYYPNSLVGDIEEGTNIFDKYLGEELIFEQGPNGSQRKGTVIKCCKSEDGRPTNTSHSDPFLDTRQYDVEIDGVPH